MTKLPVTFISFKPIVNVVDSQYSFLQYSSLSWILPLNMFNIQPRPIFQQPRLYCIEIGRIFSLLIVLSLKLWICCHIWWMLLWTKVECPPKKITFNSTISRGDVIVIAIIKDHGRLKYAEVQSQQMAFTKSQSLSNNLRFLPTIWFVQCFGFNIA